MKMNTIMLEKPLQKFDAAPAGASDAYYICEIYDKCVEALHGGELNGQRRGLFFAEIREMLTSRDPDEENFLIYIGALPIGWLKVNGLDGGDIGWISMLAVERDFRRHGAGRFAVDFAESFSASKGKQFVRIKTTEDNFPARTLYEICGYTVVEHKRAMSGDGLERTYLTFEKSLDKSY